jgi:hypothetical protein
MSNTTENSNSVARVLHDFLNGAPEVTVFMTCCAIVNELRALEQAFQAGELPESVYHQRFQSVLQQLEGAVAATERFDILLPLPAERQFSPFFWRWYNWWNDYFKCLTPFEIGEVGRLAREHLPEVEQHRPGGRWWECRDVPALVLPTNNN